MTTFVLVHGAWHGGWCWRRVAERLEAAGHRVHAPTLTGLGERLHLATPDLDVNTHVADIENLLRFEELDDVVLAGHSYGGFVITGVADRAPERLRALVYIDAFVPPEGARRFDFPDPARLEEIRALAERGDGWRVPAPPAERWGVTHPADRDWVERLCTPHPLRCFTEALSLTGAHRRVARRGFILAAGYAGSPFHRYYELLKDDPAWRVSSLPAGHDLMVTMPGELAGLLSDMA